MDETVKHAKNLEEAAQYFGVSVPTVRRWIAHGAPVVRQGGNGVGYEIDVLAMAAWRRESAAEAVRDREERDAQRAERDRELQKELLGTDASPDDDQAAFTAHQREALTRAELGRIRLARERGELVEYDQLAFKVARVVGEFRDRLLVMPEQIGRRCGLDDATIEGMQAEVEAVLEEIADAIENLEAREEPPLPRERAPVDDVGTMGTMTGRSTSLG